MPTQAEWRRAFARAVHVGRPNLALDQAALLVAAEERQDLDVAAHLRQLDTIAERVAAEIKHELDPYLIIGTMNRVLFKDLGFRGNLEEYYDPQNSFLDQVLERRLGIPITLSIVYLEVARRCRLPVVGVSFPGHFLVSYESADERIVLDCFRSGEVVLPRQFQARLDEMFDKKLRFRSEFLDPAPSRAILARLLTNLKAIYWRRNDYRHALGVSERLILVNPNLPEEYRDRGVLRAHLREYAAALPDLEHYLALVPEAPDAARVRWLANRLRSRRRA
jgi:regulator of sirC expression with transglutaminase-like and TPR domain